jgi:hypothetical protein
VRWYGQTWDVRWLPDSVLDVVGRHKLGEAPPIVKARYGPPLDADNPFA